MPSWWRGKSKSYSNSFGRRKDAESSSSSLNHGSKLSKKDKAKSFDEVICRSNYRAIPCLHRSLCRWSLWIMQRLTDQGQRRDGRDRVIFGICVQPQLYRY
ncbi:unnamed protein product [Spirodela intermedia]|uniref:Uncharacterized protein n=1 Tax=Spirodela intermedia TaxID=51605 RepID=A0A7I8IQW8_SPIIN|nr:unnamed protein product [Spirodela intermedia]CAA6660368.1 unnamed protein product [Spirodela intermedia]